MKTLKTIYYIFIAFIAIVTVLLVISIFPITGNIKFMVVQSGSMEPVINMGGIIMIKPFDNYKIGDVISFGDITKNKIPITHRIHDMKVDNGRISYITKGDANDAPDKKVISEKDIIGKVLFDVPYLGYAVNFVKKPLGFFLIILIPVVIIICDEVRKIWKEIKKKDSNI